MQQRTAPEQRVLAARAELAATLDAIDDKLNVPKRARAATARIRESVRRNPAPWIAGVVGAGLVLAGAIAWTAVRRSR
ncbi:MAG: hypothetical protein BGO95_08990 [Micrococcales bacterium 73-13]|nr:MAG: hypothetical protein BGO95_08990 [Micrococcales bacterium 73-13]